MYETANVRDLPATTVLEFVSVTLPEHWDGRHTVGVTDAEGDHCQLAVHPCVQDALRRACLLAPANLCTRIDVGYRETEDHGLPTPASGRVFSCPATHKPHV